MELLYNQSVGILGGGAWGTALATLLAEHNHRILIWCHEQMVAEAINTRHSNPVYLPNAQLCGHIKATTHLEHVLHTNKWIVVATPVMFLRSLLEQAKPYVTSDKVWILVCKGIEDHTFMLPSQILDDVLGYQAQSVVLAGPNFAQELLMRQFTATMLASTHTDLTHQAARLLSTIYFKPYYSSDTLGIQACSAFKNVLAIMYGIAQGAGCQENTKAFLLTQGLQEMSSVSTCFGGRIETAYGLAGVGDTILTCTGGLSKNTRLGIAFGQGMNMAQVQSLFPVLPEGLNTLRSLEHFMRLHHHTWPICLASYQFIIEGIPFEQFLQRIVSNP